MEVQYLKTYERWLSQPLFSQEEKKELLDMEGDEEKIRDAFYKDLTFGTAGLRGIMGMGTNRMNRWVIGRVTQGIVRYLLKNEETPSVAISFDSRNQSREFAQRAAAVLAAGGIRVHLFKQLMPVPALSFAIRHLHCTMGIMITASHNEKIYNGYKVYGSDGGQILAETAGEILASIEEVDLFGDVPLADFQEALQGSVSYIQEDTEEAYYKAVMALSTGQDLSDLTVCYTPLFGAGNLPVREVLARAGIGGLHVVSQQEGPDGNFPGTPNPNPELPEIYTHGEALCQKVGGDLVLATDPDSDRLGAAVPTGDGTLQVMTGNEIAVVLLDYLMKARTLPENPLIIRTIVSTPLVDALAERRGAQVIQTLIGFKYIGHVLSTLEKTGEENRFVMGFEEGNGFLASSYLRDKDGVGTALLLCQAAAWHKSRGKTLLEALDSIYRQYGYYKEKVISYVFEGADGMGKMEAIMDRFRENQREPFLGEKAIRATDYKAGSINYLGSSKSCSMSVGMRPTKLPKENILEFLYENHTSFVIRPSGTEPKIKLYFFARSKHAGEAEELLAQLEAKARGYIEEFGIH